MSLTTRTTGQEVAPRAQTSADERARVRPLLAVVVPCLNEELIVEQTATRLTELLRQLSAHGQIDPASFVYFVDDGSRDATWAIVEALHDFTPPTQHPPIFGDGHAHERIVDELLSRFS